MGAGRCPAEICASNSDWICASEIVEPLFPADGVIWNNPPKVPKPNIWLVPPGMFVLYCCSRLMYPLLLPVRSAKKLPIVGDVFPATCELYEPLPYSTSITCTLEMIGPPK